MQQVDCVLHARWIAPVEPAVVWDHHALVLNGGRIVDCLPSELARSRYQAAHTLTRSSHLVIPGLINTEVDLASTLWRSQMLTLSSRFSGVPRGIDRQLLTDSITLGLIEQACAGITSCVDWGHYSATVATLAADLGLRVVLGLPVDASANDYAATLDECLERSLALHDEYREHPLIHTAFALHAVPELGDSVLSRVRVLADQLERVLLLQADATQIRRLTDLGLWNTPCTLRGWTDPAALPVSSAISLVHSPAADWQAGHLPAGISAPLQSGSNVTLGSGCRPVVRDLLEAMRLTGRQSQLLPSSPLRPAQLLTMATLNCARAVGLEDSLGSLSPGKRADCVCVDLNHPATAAVLDPLLALTACAGREAVTDVWVAGRPIVVNGRFQALDRDDFSARVRHSLATVLASNPNVGR